MTLICYCAETDKIITSPGKITYVPPKAENSQRSFSTKVNSRDFVSKYKMEEIPHRSQTHRARTMSRTAEHSVVFVS